MLTSTDPRDRLIVALDFPSAALALAHVERLERRCRWFKVGLELYLASGSGIVTSLRNAGYEVFLDLKLHDIPNTVAGAVRAVSPLGASLLTVHAAGGAAMLAAAAEAAASSANGPRLLAVTVLTSMDQPQLRGVGVQDSTSTQVLRLARLARAAGIDGMVCSAEEVARLRSDLGDSSLLVVPGIRPAGAARGDQKRVATPAMAIADGASMLVVGRPVTQAADPGAAVDAILAEMTAVQMASSIG
jgi:orotidine-5'-phosphate decarboxylase